MFRAAFLVVCLAIIIPGTEASTLTVCASGCQFTTVQSSIDAAAPGDLILLRAGETFTGNIVLRAKSSSSTSYITIRSDASLSNLPAVGVRLIPPGRSGANVSSSQLARLIGSPIDRAAPVIRTEAGAHHYQLQFLDIDGASSQGYYTLIALGENSSTQTSSNAPHHITFDRVFAHGDSKVGIQRGIALNGSSIDIINSYFTDFFSVDEAQAIAGFNGAGPFRIENNFLEASTENVMFGGSDPRTTGLVPSDIVIRGNYFYKRPAFMNAALATPGSVSASATTGGSLSSGTHYFKVVAMLRSGGLDVVSAPSAQVSATVSSSGAVRVSWGGVSNALFYRVFRGTSSNGQSVYVDTSATAITYTGSGESSGSPDASATKWSVKNLLELKNAQRVTVEDNLFENSWQAAQNGFAVLLTPRNQEGTAPWSVVRDITFRRNILRHVAAGIVIQGHDDEHSSQQTVNVGISNNLFDDVSAAYGESGAGQTVVITSSPSNVTINHNTILSDGTVVVVDNGQVSGFVYTNNFSKHNTYGIFGSGAGVGTAAINAYFPNAVFSRNVLAGGSASDYPSGNYFPSVTTFNNSFVDPSSGNYQLVSTSPYLSAATDGTAIGIDYPSLQVAQSAGVSSTTSSGGTTPPDSGGSSGGSTGSVLPDGWLTDDVGAVGAVGSASYSSGVYTVYGGGADVWGTTDAFRYVYRSLSGDGSIVARVADVVGSQAWTKVGVMIRGSLSPSSAHAFMIVSEAKGLAFQRRQTDGASSLNTAVSLDTAPMWVKLTRAGSVVTAYASANGTSWTMVGSDTIALPSTALIGLAVSSHTTSATALGTFDQVTVSTGAAVPSGWSDGDIGAVGKTGSSTQSSGVYTVKGAGADIWGTSDAFHYVYRAMSGDGQIIARVSSVSGTAAWTKVGVMVRQTLDAGSAQAMMLVSLGKGMAFQRRTVTGGTSANTNLGGGTAPQWLRLTRQGSTVTAWTSGDGQNWQAVASDTLSISGSVYVGLAVSSHDTTTLATGVFDSVLVTP